MNSGFKNSLTFVGPIALDQATKFWAFKELAAPLEITSFLNFEFALNKGVSWGFFNNSAGTPIYVKFAIGLAIVFLILNILNSLRKGRSIIPQLFVLSGALSNVFDRFLYGGVVDFIVFHFGSWSFPAFNIADTCIVLGVFWMFLAYEE